MPILHGAVLVDQLGQRVLVLDYLHYLLKFLGLEMVLALIIAIIDHEHVFVDLDLLVVALALFKIEVIQGGWTML